jgi:hypothetical protein
MPAALYCPDSVCTHRAALHFADQDKALWGCSIDGCRCSLGYEETGDLVAGRLKDEGEKLLDDVAGAIRETVRSGQDAVVEFARLDPIAHADLENVELASALIVGGIVAKGLPIGRPLPGIIFRFLRAGGDYWRDRVYLCEVGQLEDLRRILNDAIDGAKRAFEALE